MPLFWSIIVLALCLLVLLETGLLFLFLQILHGVRRQVQHLTDHQASLSGTGGLALGEQAPAFTALDQDGIVVKSDEFRGNKHLFLFVLPGCPACSSAIDALNLFVRGQHELNAFVIGSSDHASNGEYRAKLDKTLSILTPTEPSTLLQIYQVAGVPFAFVLDEQGVIQAKGVINRKEQIDRLIEPISIY